MDTVIAAPTGLPFCRPAKSSNVSGVNLHSVCLDRGPDKYLKIKYNLKLFMCLLNSLNISFSGFVHCLNSQVQRTLAQFGHIIYLMTGALDQSYGFVWLNACHLADESAEKCIHRV